MKVFPSLLSADFSKLGAELSSIETAKADGVHLDIMDGVFVPNLTFGPPIVKSLRPHTKLDFDCHLMVTNPDPLIEPFKFAGANGITVHLESCPHIQRTLSQIRSHGLRAGVALNPGTDFKGLNWVLDQIDLVLVMTVNPGFGGQKLIEPALSKAGALSKWLDKECAQLGLKKPLIQIDGGVDPSHVARAKELGVDILVAGTAVFGTKDYAKAIAGLRG